MAEVMETGDGNVAALGEKAGEETMFSSDERRKAFFSLLRDCEVYCSPGKSVSPASSSESEESTLAAESVSDLKEIVFETDDTAHSNGNFSREIRPSAGILCWSEMERSKEEEILTVEKPPSSSSSSSSPSSLEDGGRVRTPSAAEIEEFFSASEKYQQKLFREKYNYDVEKDLPLEGRYEWVPLKATAAAPRCSAIAAVKRREDERA
ncbi:unnamed protein product [Cuscuta campestris]|uniref:Cyclin-dependent kinase inhibitor domain-containing protein n=1 Tax=Cuscuta campestris TaxID=132261 RepID=A0A484KMW5_9ASTE|nr:unnamed protein product [Cuscuta campestris]